MNYARNGANETRSRAVILRLRTAASTHSAMKFRALVFVSLLIASSALGGRLPSPADPYRQLSTVNKLPVQLDPAFQFRKKKLLLLGVPQVGSAKLKSSGLLKPRLKDPAVGYEGSYRLWG